MKLFPSVRLRAFLTGVLFITFGTALGAAQPKAEQQPDADRARSAGILVVEVQAGSPAEKAGISRGDIILEIQGTAVNTTADLERAIEGRKVGDTLSVKLRHGDVEKTVSLTFGDYQGKPWAGIIPMVSMPMFGLGMHGQGMPGMAGRPGFPFPMGTRMADVQVMSVTSGSPAEKAGLKQGDVILSLDGARIDPRRTLAEMIAARKAGDTVTLSVISAGQDTPRDVKVTLGKNPDKDGAWLGIGYAWTRQGRMAGPQGGAMIAGVLVAEVADNGPAAKAGIKARDIITAVEGVSVTDPQLVADAVSKHKSGDSLLLTVYRMADDKETDVTVTLAQSPVDPARAYMGITMTSFMGFEGMPSPGPWAPGAPGTGGMQRAPGSGGGQRSSGDGGESPTI
jgi:S1-C subfamily serine protease